VWSDWQGLNREPRIKNMSLTLVVCSVAVLPAARLPGGTGNQSRQIGFLTNDQPEFSETEFSHLHLPMKYPGRKA
jgi:hypothetical protein